MPSVLSVSCLIRIVCWQSSVQVMWASTYTVSMANYSRSYSIIDDNDPALERRRLFSSIEAEKHVSTNSDYIYATWQNAIALDNARLISPLFYTMKLLRYDQNLSIFFRFVISGDCLSLSTRDPDITTTWPAWERLLRNLLKILFRCN